MMAFLIAIYLSAGPVVSLGKLIIDGHLYDEKNFVRDYFRLAALWPLVIIGRYE